MEKGENVIEGVMKVEVDENPLPISKDKEEEEEKNDKEEEEKIDEEDDDNERDQFTKAKEKKFNEMQKDFYRKYLCAQNVIKACQQEELSNLSPIEKLHRYTKVPISQLSEMFEDIPSGEQKSLRKIMEETKKLESSETSFIYSDLRDIFIDSFVERQQMLSVAELMKELTKKRNNSYENISMTRLIKNNLVKYHYLKDLNSYILTENPEFSYKRHLYLKQVMRYRIKRSIVYVTIQIQTEGASLLCVLIAASAKNGLITSKSFKKTMLEDSVSVSIEHKVKTWLWNELIPRISTNSVVVLQRPRIENSVPTPYSSRKEMIDWLKDRCMPLDESSHSAQLYHLIKISKKQPKGLYEQVLASAGLKVLICPVEYKQLDFFYTFKESILLNATDTLEKITRIAKLEWKQLEERLVEQEKQILRDDEQMDKVIENIFQMVKNGDLKKEDFRGHCHATKATNFAYHIGDFVID